MISDEEARERIQAFVGATGTTMAEVGEGMKRLSGILAAAARSVGELSGRITQEDERTGSDLTTAQRLDTLTTDDIAALQAGDGDGAAR